MESSEATAEATFAATLTPIRCNGATDRNRQLPPLSVRVRLRVALAKMNQIFLALGHRG